MRKKYWYAVQSGKDFAWDYGAYRYSEARKMATALHKENPDDEVRICYIDEACNFCDDVDIIYEGKK